MTGLTNVAKRYVLDILVREMDIEHHGINLFEFFPSRTV